MNLKIKRLTDTAILPTRNKDGDMGFDIYADETITVYGDKTETVSTGVAIECPKGFGAFLVARSGRTIKTPYRVNLGVIDNGYRGELLVMSDVITQHNGNTNLSKVNIEPGDKIAQLVLLPIFDGGIEEVDELSDSSRGGKGFGSSGNK